MNNDFKLDIVKNITVIESLKCGLLSSVSGLYESLSGNSRDELAKMDFLAEIVINAFLLADKTGMGSSELLSEIYKRLEVGKGTHSGSALNNEALTESKKDLLDTLKKLQ